MNKYKQYAIITILWHIVFFKLSIGCETMIRMLKMLKPYRGTLILSILFSAVYAVLEILIPIFTKYILSEGIISKDMNNIIYYGAIMLLIPIA